MISPSSVSTCMTLASSVLVWRRPPVGAAGETAKLILVLEAHATAHSTAPGARLSDDLKDQVSTTSTGDRAPFSARNGTPRQGRPMTVRGARHSLGGAVGIPCVVCRWAPAAD